MTNYYEELGGNARISFTVVENMQMLTFFKHQGRYNNYFPLDRRTVMIQLTYNWGTVIFSWPFAVTHLISFTLLLLLLLLFLVFLLVVALTSFPPGCSCLSNSGLPSRVPSAFGGGLPWLRGVGVGVGVYLKQGETGGGGGDGDHCRRCHCVKGKLKRDNKRHQEQFSVCVWGGLLCNRDLKPVAQELASSGNLFSAGNITLSSSKSFV